MINKYIIIIIVVIKLILLSFLLSVVIFPMEFKNNVKRN